VAGIVTTMSSLPAAPDSTNTTALGVHTGDILCEGYICRAAVLDAKRPYALDFLMHASPQGIGVRASTSRLLTDPTPGITTTAPGHHLLCPLCMASAGWVISRALQSPGLCCPHSRELSLLGSLSAAGEPGHGFGASAPGAAQGWAEGGAGAQAQPVRCCVISPGGHIEA